MEQKKNILQIFGDFIEEKGYSWIIPSKKESLSETMTNCFSLVLLIPLFVMVLAIRFIILFFKLLFGLLLSINAPDDLDKTVTQNKSIIKTVVLGVLIICTFLFSIRILHESAKKTNVSLRDSREFFDFETDAIEDAMPYDFVLASAFKAIKESMENEYSDRDVVRLRKQLYIDDDFAKGLHFSSPDDFVVFLYSLKDIDKRVYAFISEADSIGNYDKLLKFYREAALNDYEKGNYHNAYEEVNHFFNIYTRQKDFPFTGVNNKMHLLKLLLQHKGELFENREFAKEAYMCFANSDWDNKSNNFDGYSNLLNISKENSFMKDVSSYYEGLSNFHDEDYAAALQIFESCFEKTSDSTLKQYCALMAIRTAFWGFSDSMAPIALNDYETVFDKYASVITYPYFKSDLNKYQLEVFEIKNNSSRFIVYENE